MYTEVNYLRLPGPQYNNRRVPPPQQTTTAYETLLTQTILIELRPLITYYSHWLTKSEELPLKLILPLPRTQFPLPLLHLHRRTRIRRLPLPPHRGSLRQIRLPLVVRLQFPLDGLLPDLWV